MVTKSICRWLELILFERFGVAISVSNLPNRFILTVDKEIGAIIFDNLENGFFMGFASEDHSCVCWNAKNEGFDSVISDMIPAPGVSVLQSPLVKCEETIHYVRYDILGLTFWMLNRVEEVGRTDLDIHSRFPATASHAFQNNYLERPIVDEWLHILAQVVKKQWPRLEIKKHSSNIKVSHDVDNPSLWGFKPWRQLARSVVGDIVRRSNVNTVLERISIRAKTKNNLYAGDPVNTFDWIMQTSETYGLSSAFYFICGRTDRRYDADYEIEHPAIRDLLRRIHQRGHEIGLHPSYDTYQSPSSIMEEAKRLRTVAAEEGVQQDAWGGRMHYLRWEHPRTLRGWVEAGLNYDSSLGYADHPGFRCGTCFEYQGFDAVTDKILPIKIRPLIAMETTIFSKNYLGLTGEEALQKFLVLKTACKAVGGSYTLLWHNCQLQSDEDRDLYTQVLKCD